VIPLAKPLLKTVGRELLNTGVGVASDLLDGEKIGRSLESRSRKSAKILLKKAQKKMKGNGLGKAAKRSSTAKLKGVKTKDIFKHHV
jgi:hypothetical protein